VPVWKLADMAKQTGIIEFLRRKSRALGHYSQL
jgi:hypothetical protein